MKKYLLIVFLMLAAVKVVHGNPIGDGELYPRSTALLAPIEEHGNAGCLRLTNKEFALAALGALHVADKPRELVAGGQQSAKLLQQVFLSEDKK